MTIGSKKNADLQRARPPVLGEQRHAASQRMPEHGDRSGIERIDHVQQVVGEAGPVETVVVGRGGIAMARKSSAQTWKFGASRAASGW